MNNTKLDKWIGVGTRRAKRLDRENLSWWCCPLRMKEILTMFQILKIVEGKDTTVHVEKKLVFGGLLKTSKFVLSQRD